jgi:hypothetical protein
LFNRDGYAWLGAWLGVLEADHIALAPVIDGCLPSQAGEGRPDRRVEMTRALRLQRRIAGRAEHLVELGKLRIQSGGGLHIDPSFPPHRLQPWTSERLFRQRRIPDPHARTQQDRR